MPQSVQRRSKSAPAPESGASAPRRGRPQPAESDAIVKRLREVAFRHFLNYGLERASVIEIAKEAGVTRQVIYNRFRDKRGLFDEVMRHREAQFFQTDAFSISEHGTREERLTAIGMRLIDHMLDPGQIVWTRMMIGGLNRCPDLVTSWASSRERVLSKFASRLAAMDDAGSDAATELSRMQDFVAMLSGATFPILIGISPALSPADRERIVSRAVRRITLV